MPGVPQESCGADARHPAGKLRRCHFHLHPQHRLQFLWFVDFGRGPFRRGGGRGGGLQRGARVYSHAFSESRRIPRLRSTARMRRAHEQKDSTRRSPHNASIRHDDTSRSAAHLWLHWLQSGQLCRARGPESGKRLCHGWKVHRRGRNFNPHLERFSKLRCNFSVCRLISYSRGCGSLNSCPKAWTSCEEERVELTERTPSPLDQSPESIGNLRHRQGPGGRRAYSQHSQRIHALRLAVQRCKVLEVGPFRRPEPGADSGNG